MILPEVNEQTSSVKQICNSYISSMELIKKSINTFILEPELKGKTYESAKEYFAQAYIPLANGIILLSEAIIKAHQQFPQRYIEEVDNNSLDSDILQGQIQKLEHTIQSMKSVQLGLPAASVAITGAITTLRFLQLKIKDKLQRLEVFHGNSSEIFSNIDQLLVSVEKGLSEVTSGKAWNAYTFDSSKLDLEWAKELDAKTFYAKIVETISLENKLNEKDILKLFKVAQENPDVEIPSSVLSYVKENIISILYGLSGSIFSESYKALGVELKETGEAAIKNFGKDGKIQFKDFPIAKNFIDKDLLNNINKFFDKTGKFFIRQGNNLTRVGTALGGSLSAAGFAIGMHDDLANEDKTVGVAIAHNATVAGAGLGASALVGLGSTPVGWGIVGVAAVGISVSILAERAYQTNFLGFQYVIDSVGEAIQHGIENPVIIGVFPLHYIK